jgi:hypothetical protein
MQIKKNLFTKGGREVAVEWLSFLHYILEKPASILGPETAIQAEVFNFLLPPLQGYGSRVS